MRTTQTTLILAGFGASLIACSGISDCEQDGEACAAMLVESGAACAEAYQLKHTERKRKYCEHAVDVVGDQEIAAAVPGLIAMLKAPHTNVPDDNHVQDAAKALGEIKDPAAVDALVAALDMKAGTSSEPRDKMANRANEAIAEALGEIGAEEATPALLELMDASRNDHVVLKAVRALGQIEDERAVEKLEDVALNHPNKFMRKNSVIALGDIGSPKAVDTLIQMMFIEYQGVSFYREASFALFQVGEPAAEPLLETMAMKNEAVNAIFEKSGGIKESAIKAKCGFVLGDLRDERAVEPLLEAFQEAVEKRDPVVLGFTAPPLGALGDERAVKVLAEEMGTIDQSLRDPFMQALVMIGDQSVVDDMIPLITRRDFVRKCRRMGNSRQACVSEEDSMFGAQETAIDHTTNLAGAEHLDALEKVLENEPSERIQKYLDARMVRVRTAAECQDDAACWAGKLKSDDPLLRERAAWDLKRLKDPSTLDALAEALDDSNRKARYAAIQAYWAYGDDRAVDLIRKTLKKEESSADFVRVNEDLKRLLVHLKRTEASA
ncbi:MAG TPA: HEAT repeat domain-containing protein [Myxococcales bacterium LLY-WYZ-16_1]|nr:HEAT repeat domain-containing protein [Myxococcales bacterium LLY-WYZ-16_1]